MRPPVPIVVEPGFTPPGTGLPEYWAPPEHKPPDVQPNPRPKRYLPPTREPGLWSAEEPRASDPSTGKPRLEIAGVPLPVPEPEWSVNPLEAYAPLLCHGLISDNSFSPGYVLKGDDFTPEQKECLIATWYAHCLSWAAERIVDPKNKGTINIVLGHFWKRYVDPASKFEREKCTPEILSSRDRHGRESVKDAAQLPAGYWDDVYKSYRRTHP